MTHPQGETAMATERETETESHGTEDPPTASTSPSAQHSPAHARTPRLALPHRLLRGLSNRSSSMWRAARDGEGSTSQEGGQRHRDYDDERFLDEVLQARAYTAGDNGSEDDGGDGAGTVGHAHSSRAGFSGAGASNGIRVWYESYTTIDWIHDAVKESSRLRRVRSIDGVRGLLYNTWDRLQGWLIVTITGIATALIAGGIVTSEAVLFDLKEGYCKRDWRLAKRFCCPYGDQPDWDGNNGGTAGFMASNVSGSPWTYRTRLMSSGGGASDPSKGLLTGMGSHFLTGWASPTASSPKWRGLDESDACPGWVVWGDKFALMGERRWVADYGMYIAIAILWATIASLLTIYLTSSELYTSKKDTLAESSRTSYYVKGQSHSFESTETQQQAQSSTERSPLLTSSTKRPNTTSYTSPSPDAANASNAVPPKLLAQIANHVRAQEALPPRKVLYFGSGSGISEVKCILSGFVIHGYLGFWTLFTKSVGLTLSVASGLSLGKEGPFVHIASCVGNIVCRVFPKYETNESKRREILSCACAAGVAVAFGAPVGGVLFSLEEVSYYFPAKVMFRSFFCAMVAAATLRFLDPFGTGKIVLFQVTYDRDWHWVELAFFVFIGLFGGLYGAFFTRLNVIWSKNVRAKTWMARHPLLEVVMITVISVAVAFLNDYTRMSGPELIADLFSECHEHESLDGLCVSRPSQIGPLVGAVAWTMVAKGLLTIITFGIKLPAGIFIPTLAVGACFGRIVGLLVQYTQWTHQEAKLFQWCDASDSACIVPGVYAMVGAAAALSGVTRTTVSLVVIMFELTGTLTYAVPVMLAVLVARTVADALEHKGIYDLVMEFSGLPYLDAKEEHTWFNVSILDAVDTGVETISLDENNTVTALRQKLERLALLAGNPDGGFPIVTSQGFEHANKMPKPGGNASASTQQLCRLAGYISAQELEHGLNRLCAAESRADPSHLVCTFNFLPRPTSQGAPAVAVPPGLQLSESNASLDGNDVSMNTEDAEHMMRDSTLLASVDEPRDLSLFVDRAPMTVTTSSPLEMVHQLFVKLGVRYLVVLHADGTLKGVIFKKRWLAFLHATEGGKHK